MDPVAFGHYGPQVARDAVLTPGGTSHGETTPNVLCGDIVQHVKGPQDPTGERQPVLVHLPAPADPNAIVLLMHGGRESGYGRVPAHRLSFVRMRPFARAVHERSRDAAVVLLRYRYRGWNAPDAHPVHDTEGAVDELLNTHGALPVILVGHSMGGRAALRAAGHPRVVAVAGLAPWLPGGEPIDQLEERDVLLMHGTADVTTRPKATAELARTIAPVARRVACIQIKRSGHGMLQRAGLWHELTSAFVDNVVNGSPLPAPLLEAFQAGARGDAIRI